MNPKTNIQYRARAAAVALAWQNAAIAFSNEEARGALYRTVLVEFFKGGIQFVGCDGTMLFRTWVPFSDNGGDLVAPMPRYGKLPLDSVVVMDIDKFALGFMKTLLAACSGDDFPYEITFSIDPTEKPEEPALGTGLGEYVLTLQAVGQRLSCKLYDGAYPNWRTLQFGMDTAERVEGMTLATKMFAAVGKLKGVSALDLEFRGEDRAIWFRDRLDSIHGLLMPMRREKEKRPDVDDGVDQVEHDS